MTKIKSPSTISNLDTWDEAKRYISQLVDDLVAHANTTAPSGSIIAFGGEGVPAGFLECDGSEVRRDAYSTLFSAIGGAWGAGNGTTTFRIPDLRGRYLRGWDHGSLNSAGVAQRTAPQTNGVAQDHVGSLQGDAETGSSSKNAFVMYIIKT